MSWVRPTNEGRTCTGKASRTGLVAPAGETARTTEYLIDYQSPTGLWQPVTETEKNAAGQPVRRVSYAFGSDELTQTVSQLDPSTGAVVSATTHTFLHDGHGSVRALVGAAAAVAQAFYYTAYGELVGVHSATGALVSSSAADALTSLMYSGEAFDARTGLQFLRARWYRPEMGGFDRLDPFDGDPTSPFSYNKYAYTSGDPIAHGDPTGLFDGLIGLITPSSK